MRVEIVANLERTTLAALAPALENAIDIRVAVAFVSQDGLSKMMPHLEIALQAGANIEFLVGMDPHATDPKAIKELYAMHCANPQLSLLCFAPRNTNAIYHPKVYLARDNETATALIGSSNLTQGGLTKNFEANVILTASLDSEIISEIYSTYAQWKYHRQRVIPDEEFIDLFVELCNREKLQKNKLARDPALRRLRETFSSKTEQLQHPKPNREDLVGWLKMVYEVLPQGSFTNRQIYRYEREFQQRYPSNQNIQAKIRQQLQLLHKIGFIEHVGRGVWKKVD